MSFRSLLADAGKNAWGIVKVVALVAIPVALLLFHVWNQYQLTSLGYEVAEQTRKHRELMQEHRKLSIEAAYQGRTERMLSVAKERFGLETLEPDQVIEVGVGDQNERTADQAGEPEFAELEIDGE